MEGKGTVEEWMNGWVGGWIRNEIIGGRIVELDIDGRKREWIIKVKG